MAEPRPRPVKERGTQPDARRFDCVFYQLCLNTAVVEGWPGFTCAECGAYEAEPKTNEGEHRE